MKITFRFVKLACLAVVLSLCLPLAAAPKALSTSDIQTIIDQLPHDSIESVYAKLKIIRSDASLVILGLNRELAQDLISALRERLQASDAASTKTLAHVLYTANAVEQFKRRNHANLYFKKYLGLKNLVATALMQISRNEHLSPEEVLTAFVRREAPAVLQSLTGEAAPLALEDLRVPPSETTFREIFEFATNKGLVRSGDRYELFVDHFIADEGVFQIFSPARGDLRSTRERFEDANRARLLGLVEFFGFPFVYRKLDSKNYLDLRFAEELLRTHSFENVDIDLEVFLKRVNRLRVAVSDQLREPALTQDEAVERMRALESLRKTALARRSQFSKRIHSQHIRKLYVDALGITKVDALLSVSAKMPARTYQIETFSETTLSGKTCPSLFR